MGKTEFIKSTSADMFKSAKAFISNIVFSYQHTGFTDFHLLDVLRE